jgi:hypothetical protein
MNPYTPPAANVDATTATASARPLGVALRNSFIDLMLFQAYFLLRSPVFLLLLFGAPVAITFPDWMGSTRDLTATVVLVATTLIWASVLFLAQIAFVLVWVLVHKDKNFYRSRTLELSEHSIVDQTALTRYEVQWPAVHGVTRTPWCLYIRLTPQVAHCVPPRAFPNREAYAHFADTAVTFYEHSRSEQSGR